jgi:hypothetical protein
MSSMKLPIDQKQVKAEALLKMQPLVRTLLRRSKGFQENDERGSYAPWFKEAVYDLLNTEGVTYQDVTNLTGIAVKTLEKFLEFVEQLKLEKKPITELHLLVERAWEMASDFEKKSSTSS